MAKQWSAALGAVSSFETRHARGPGAFTPITPISRLWYSGFVQSRGLSDVRNGVDKFARVIGSRVVKQSLSGGASTRMTELSGCGYFAMYCPKMK